MTMRLVAALLLLAGCTDAAHDPAAQHSDSTRQAEVAERGAEVMPFDLEKTMHVFEDQPYGGLQRVVARQPSDTTQIRLIREHLREEARLFAAGDYEDPMRIHGHDMPGLAELSAAAGELDVEYSDLPDGGQIRYTAEDSALVAAVHRWFAAQRSDHGSHARGH